MLNTGWHDDPRVIPPGASVPRSSQIARQLARSKEGTIAHIRHSWKEQRHEILGTCRVHNTLWLNSGSG
jgi:hypothetical protein